MAEEISTNSVAYHLASYLMDVDPAEFYDNYEADETFDDVVAKTEQQLKDGQAAGIRASIAENYGESDYMAKETADILKELDALDAQQKHASKGVSRCAAAEARFSDVLQGSATDELQMD